MKKSVNTRKIIIFTTIFLFISSCIVSIIIIGINKSILDKNTKELYIYQYTVDNYNFKKNEEPILYKKIDFNKETQYEETIYSLDNSHYNTVVINNGKVYISSSDCTYKYCMNEVIDLDEGLINNIDITCLCNGLYIVIK